MLYSLCWLRGPCNLSGIWRLQQWQESLKKGDDISIYLRISSLQGWQAESKRSETMSCTGEGMRPCRCGPNPGMAGFRQRPEVGGQNKCGGWPQRDAGPNTMISVGRQEPSNMRPIYARIIRSRSPAHAMASPTTVRIWSQEVNLSP